MDIFSVVVIMSIATTLVVPPALTAIYRRSPEIGASSVVTRDVSDEFDAAGDGVRPHTATDTGEPARTSRRSDRSDN